MKKLCKAVVALLVATATTGCGTTLFNTVNSNTSLTNVELSHANYRIVDNVEGFSSATYILGIGGLSRRAVRENAVADMMRKAQMTGSQTIVNVHVKQHISTVSGLYTRVAVAATAQVIEFLPEEAPHTARPAPEETAVERVVSSTPQIEEKARPEPEARSYGLNNPTKQRYTIGDLYDDGKLRGYVFELFADGQHGKIVYPELLAQIPWCTKAVQDKIPGTTDAYDGEKNMQIIRALPDWQTNYPAFAACAELGPTWYLPAVNEMTALQQIKKIRQMLSHDVWTSTHSKRHHVQTSYWKNVLVTDLAYVVAVSKF